MAVKPDIEVHTTTSDPAPEPSQAQIQVPTPSNDKKLKVMLIPFDPESEEQSDRLQLTRIACGWKADKIPLWRERQRSGDMSIHWVVSLSLSCFNCRMSFYAVSSSHTFIFGDKIGMVWKS